LKIPINLVFLCVILFSIVFSLSSCWIFRTPREPQIDKITNVKVGKMHEGSVDLTIFAKLYNPDKVKFKIKKVDLDVTINGHVVARITSPKTIRIPKETDPEIQWTVNANLLKLIKPGMLLSVFTQQKMKLGVSGNIRVKKSFYSKTIPVKLDRPFEIPYK
jgi:LEA14-like dessication related protein